MFVKLSLISTHFTKSPHSSQLHIGHQTPLPTLPRHFPFHCILSRSLSHFSWVFLFAQTSIPSLICLFTILSPCYFLVLPFGPYIPRLNSTSCQYVCCQLSALCKCVRQNSLKITLFACTGTFWFFSKEKIIYLLIPYLFIISAIYSSSLSFLPNTLHKYLKLSTSFKLILSTWKFNLCLSLSFHLLHS